MNDRILYSSNTLSGASREMTELANVLQETITALQNVDTTTVNNNKVHLDRRLANILTHVRTEMDAANNRATGINKAIEIFDAAEKLISGVYGGDAGKNGDGSATNPYGLTDEELEQERRDAIERMLWQIDQENDMLNNLINRKDLSRITGFIADIYSLIAGEPVDTIRNAPNEIAQALLDSLLDDNGAHQLPKYITDLLHGTYKDTKLTTETAANIITIINEECGEEFGKLMKDFMDENDITTVGKAAEYASHLIDAYNQYSKILNMDPEKLRSVCSGLRQSGDYNMAQAANILENISNPAGGLAYCLVYNGVEVAVNDLSKVGRDVVISMYPDVAGQAIIKIASDVTDAATNSSGIVREARNVERLDDARRSAYNTVHNAAEEYKRNPTDANYRKVVDAHNAYKSLAAESVDSYADMAEEQNNSGLGTFINHDTGSMRRTADIIRNGIDYNNISHYQ